jgi:hypothetical protein
MASSRPLPHRQQAGSYKFEAPTKSWNTSIPCRSWLASDGVITPTTASPASPAPTNLRRPQNPGIPRYPVGAGLPAMASSRPPPHRQQAGSYKFEASTKSWNTSTPCRSWLASDGVITLTTASPASRLLQIGVVHKIPKLHTLQEPACWRWRRHIRHRSTGKLTIQPLKSIFAHGNAFGAGVVTR